MSKKYLVLVDDARRGFWERKPLWTDEQWAGFEKKTIDGQNVATIQDVYNALPTVGQNETMFIVTDGHLWNDPKGGARVLQQANTAGSLCRGVVYSTDPKLCEELSHADNVIALTRAPESERIQQIKEFFETGRKPKEFARSEAFRRLSAAIHDIENLAVPIRIDAETLGAGNSPKELPSKETLSDVFGDYFGADGYLTKARAFSNGTGIESEIAHHLTPLVALESKKLAKAIADVLTDGKVDPAKIEMLLTIKPGRDAAKLDGAAVDAEKLRDQLASVADAIRNLATELRTIRDAEEKNEEGPQ